MYFYDLLRTRDNILRPVLGLDTAQGNGGSNGNPVYTSAFNGKKPEMFATGDALGIQVPQGDNNSGLGALGIQGLGAFGIQAPQGG